MRALICKIDDRNCVVGLTFLYRLMHKMLKMGKSFFLVCCFNCLCVDMSCFKSFWNGTRPGKRHKVYYEAKSKGVTDGRTDERMNRHGAQHNFKRLSEAANGRITSHLFFRTVDDFFVHCDSCQKWMRQTDRTTDQSKNQYNGTEKANKHGICWFNIWVYESILHFVIIKLFPL